MAVIKSAQKWRSKRALIACFLPPSVKKKLDKLAEARKCSRARVLAELIEAA